MGFRVRISPTRMVLRIIGATLTPFADTFHGTPLFGYYSEDKEAKRAAINEWIRTSGAFDGVYATESLEHAVDIEKAVAEMCRVLAPGGRLVIIDKNAEHWGQLETPAWEKWFHRRELEKLLERHCSRVESRFISYWEDVPPDGLFLAWLATK